MKKIISVILAALTLVSAVALPAFAVPEPFSDIQPERWSHDAVIFAYERGYMNGVGGGRFSPGGTVTRAMVVTVLWRLEGKPAPSAPSGFSDVDPDGWYADAVAWAKETGVVNGVSATRFSPDGKITREQLAAMLFRYSGYLGYDVRVKGSLSSFPDSGTASSYAADALAWTADKGLITGVKSDGGALLAPKGNATREQFATILQRFCETDLTYPLVYNEPIPVSHYTEKEYPLVGDADVYVAPDGDDGAAGDFDHPLASFDGAVARVRAIRAEKAEGDVTVAFMAGCYQLSDVELTGEDGGTESSRTVYCAYGDGEVKFIAGVIASADEFVDLDEEDKLLFREKNLSLIKKIDLSGKVSDGELTHSSEAFTKEHGRLVAARFPNQNVRGENIYLSGIAEGIAPGKTRLAPFTSKFAKFHTLEGAEMIGCIGHEYWMTVFPLTGFDPETGIISYDVIGPQYGLEEYALGVFFSNISEELDFKNEYYISPENEALYVFDPDSDEYVISTKDHFCLINGADHLTFRGFSFIGCRDDGLVVTANDVTFDRCEIIGIGGRYGIKVLGTDFRMQDCHFGYTAGCGMWFDSNRDVNDLVPTGPYIDNCLIHDVGQKWKNLQNPGIRIKRAVGARVSHCEIYNTPSAALSYGYVAEGGSERAIDCVFEYNYLHDVSKELSDMGSVYSGRSFVNRDNVFRYNMIVRTSDQHTSFGVYLDDGIAAQKVYGNIFYDCGTLCVVNSGGQYADIHDNACIRTFPLWGDPTNAMWATAKYYYFAFDEDDEHATPWNSGNFRILYNTLKLRPMPGDEYYELWHERWPELYEVLDDYDAVDDPNCPASPGFNSIYNNYAIGFCENWIDEPVERFAVRCENNGHFDIGENPLFVNPTVGDYRIRDDVENFYHIPFELIGRY